MKRLPPQYCNQLILDGVVVGSPVELGFCAYILLRVVKEVQTDDGWIKLYPKFKIDGRGELADVMMGLQDGDNVSIDGYLYVYYNKEHGLYCNGIKAECVRLIARNGERVHREEV